MVNITDIAMLLLVMVVAANRGRRISAIDASSSHPSPVPQLGSAFAFQSHSTLKAEQLPLLKTTPRLNPQNLEKGLLPRCLVDVM